MAKRDPRIREEGERVNSLCMEIGLKTYFHYGFIDIRTEFPHNAYQKPKVFK